MAAIRMFFVIFILLVGWFLGATIASANFDANAERVQLIYVAYYGRPGDPGGVEYWAGKLDDNGGNLDQIINQFGNSEEFNQRFGGLSNSELISNLYQQMFNRSPDINGEGFSYWENQLASISLASIATRIADGAQNEDLTTLKNKISVAARIAESVEANSKTFGTNDIPGLRDLLSSVNNFTNPLIFDVSTPVGELPGDGDSEGQTILSGIFVDAPVKGLGFSTLSQFGYTNSLGQFNYKMGEEISFFIGNLSLGSAIASEVISPLSLTGDIDLGNISVQTLSIARLLQTLDQEPQNEGTISIPEPLRNLAVSDINLESEADLQAVIDSASVLTSINYTLKDSSSAQSAMIDYINLIDQYKKLAAGIYSGTGTIWYLLTMPTDGNVVIDTTGSSNASLYDSDLNSLGYFGNATPKFLEAGTYIVQAFHNAPSGGSIFVNSPALFDQSGLESLSAGSYSGTGTIWYLLTMPTDGNVIVDTLGSSNASLYDSDLNSLGYFGNATPKFLEAGTYIVQAFHNAPSGGSIFVNSPALFDQNGLEPLSAGSYSGTGTIWYLLTMPTGGNVIIDTPGSSNASLYDSDLNSLGYFGNATPKFLEAGTYIVQAFHNAPSGGVIDVSSPVLN